MAAAAAWAACCAGRMSSCAVVLGVGQLHHAWATQKHHHVARDQACEQLLAFHRELRSQTPPPQLVKAHDTATKGCGIVCHHLQQAHQHSQRPLQAWPQQNPTVLLQQCAAVGWPVPCMQTCHALPRPHLCAVVACPQAAASPVSGPSWAAAAAARPGHQWQLTAARHSIPQQRLRHRALHESCSKATAPTAVLKYFQQAKILPVAPGAPADALSCCLGTS